MDIPSAIAAESAITRQNVALSTIKKAADQNQAFAEVIAQSVKTAPVNESRGTNINLLA